MKQFIVLILKFLIPIIAVTSIYVVADPFRVIWQYDSYFENNKPGIHVNRSIAGTANFKNKYKQYKYDSYIFGNSRSLACKISDWQKHLPQPASAYHFDGAGESLYALNKKLSLINATKTPIKNAVFFVDQQLLRQSRPDNGHLFTVSPLIDPDCNTLNYHTTFLKAFLSYKFIFYYIDFKLTGQLKPYMVPTFYRPIQYNAVTNEMNSQITEDQLANGTYYTPQRMSAFYERDTVQTYFKSCIKKKQKKLLAEIASILKDNNTNYKIIINPCYDQKKLSADDMKYLRQVFGAQNVFDFSGINSITNNYQNYYEAVHYRPHVAAGILDSIY